MSYLLLVSPTPGELQVPAKALAADGHRVIAVGDGGEAWRHPQNERPDVLFLHELLPTLDGYELLAKLRSEYPHAPTKIVLAIVMPADGEPRRLWNEPVDAYVMRPYNPWQVAFSVEQLLYRNVTPNHEAVAAWKAQFDKRWNEAVAAAQEARREAAKRKEAQSAGRRRKWWKRRQH